MNVISKYGKNLATNLVIIAAISFVAGKVVLSSVISSEAKEMMALVVSDWKMKSAVEIQTVDPLTLGPDSAKMKILEFSDFLCPHCKNALPKLHNFHNVHKNDVQIIFQNFPLDGCGGPDDNPGRRCDLAKLAYCAQKQNKGWEAQDYLFGIQENNYNLSDLENKDIPQMATAIGADATVLKTCVKDPETLKTIKAQLELGKKIGIEGTPAIFINNKPFKGGPNVLTFQEIFDLI